MPRFSFFISHSREPVTEKSLIWPAPIPLRLDTLIKDEGEEIWSGGALSHGAYFRAARAFLEADSFEVMTRAVSGRLKRDIKAPDIKQICIYLEKHGEFYHPSRIDAVLDQQLLSFVLNVAFSAAGRRLIEKEYQLLHRLNNERPFHYLPQVYGFGRIAAPDGPGFAMFLGQWFEGYHEFHIAMDPVDQKLKIRVWDGARGNFFLSDSQTRTLYAQASGILTAYYDLESFEQIFSWHHAAGDFIVKTDNETLQMKLISVRRYERILENQNNNETDHVDPQRLLHALLIFFINLSIHMRLDRLDGIGEMVWSDSVAVEAALTGFLEALLMKEDIPSLPDSPLACFLAYLASCNRKDLMDLTKALFRRFNPQMPGLAVVRKNLEAHVETLYDAFQKMLSIFK